MFLSAAILLCLEPCLLLFLSQKSLNSDNCSAVSADQLLNDKQNSVVEIQNHELNEQLALISQLDEDEKNALIKNINSMLTKKRMKDLLDGKAKF